eukprot:scaffold104771_cov39-Phaeocystis_antarctica.AAC.1
MGHAEVARRASRLLDQRQPLRLRLVRDRVRVRVRVRGSLAAPVAAPLGSSGAHAMQRAPRPPPG